MPKLQQTLTDNIAHPWPPEGNKFEFRFRKGVWFIVRPWYKNSATPDFNLQSLTFLWHCRFWFPFITWNFKYFHGYIGWKPIPVALDSAFKWRDLDIAQIAILNKELFVQLSLRPFGIGKIS